MDKITRAARPAAPAPMSTFERYLTLWVFLCIVVGIALGQLLPEPVAAVAQHPAVYTCQLFGSESCTVTQTAIATWYKQR